MCENAPERGPLHAPTMKIPLRTVISNVAKQQTTRITIWHCGRVKHVSAGENDTSAKHQCSERNFFFLRYFFSSGEKSRVVPMFPFFPSFPKLKTRVAAGNVMISGSGTGGFAVATNIEGVTVTPGSAGSGTFQLTAPNGETFVAVNATLIVSSNVDISGASVAVISTAVSTINLGSSVGIDFTPLLPATGLVGISLQMVLTRSFVCQNPCRKQRQCRRRHQSKRPKCIKSKGKEDKASNDTTSESRPKPKRSRNRQEARRYRQQ
jgi:hypothetical protein